MTQNDDVYAYLKTTLDISGTLNDLLFAYYKQQTGLSNVSFNDAKRAYFQQRYGKQGTINDVAYGIEGGTNLVTNPRGKNTSGTTVVRENLALNPRGQSNTGNTPQTNSLSVSVITRGVAISDHPLGITTAVQAQKGDGSTSSDLLSVYNLDGYSNVAPAARGFGAWVKVNASGYDARFGGSAAAIPLEPNVWTYVRSTALVAANAHSVFYVKKTDGTAPLPEDRAWLTGIITEANTHPVDFFDGDTSPDPDLTPQWTGTPGASTSRLVGPKPEGLTYSAGIEVVAYYSQKHDAYALVKSSSTPRAIVFPFTPSNSRHSIVTEYFSTNPNILVRASFASGTPPTTAAPAGNGWKQLRVIQDAATGTVHALQATGAEVGTVYVRSLVASGDYSGPFFDGDSPNAKWNGTPHASTSTLFNPGRALI